MSKIAESTSPLASISLSRPAVAVGPDVMRLQLIIDGDILCVEIELADFTRLLTAERGIAGRVVRNTFGA